jgi:hypothetical protein
MKTDLATLTAQRDALLAFAQYLVANDSHTLRRGRNRERLNDILMGPMALAQPCQKQPLPGDSVAKPGGSSGTVPSGDAGLAAGI